MSSLKTYTIVVFARSINSIYVFLINSKIRRYQEIQMQVQNVNIIVTIWKNGTLFCFAHGDYKYYRNCSKN